jgi:CBS-domain-containing membrane protein
MIATVKPLLDLTAADVMSREVLTIPERMSLQEAACLLRRSRVTGAPVVNERGQCVGVLSAIDLLPWVETGGAGAAAGPLRPCPYQTEGPLLTGEEAMICTLVLGSCPWQELRPTTGGRHTVLCVRPPCAAGERRQAAKELPGDAVGRWMTADVVTAGPQTPLSELSRMMVDAHVHRIVVVDAQDRPVGIVSSTDVLAAVARARNP